MLKLKRSIYGFDFDIDIETRPPIQWIYYLILRIKWAGRDYLNREESQKFVSYALRYLPNGSFVIFSFDRNGRYFVQFCKVRNRIILDFPYRSANPFFGCNEELIALLRSIKYARNYRSKNSPTMKPDTFFNVGKKKNDVSLRADFAKDHTRAAQATILIAEKIYTMHYPSILGYTSDGLIAAHSKTHLSGITTGSMYHVGQTAQIHPVIRDARP